LASLPSSQGIAERGTRRAGVIQAILITCITSLPVIAIVSLVPAIPLLLRQFAGTPNASVLVPLIVTAPGICIALLSPLAGVIADRFGRRRLVLGAMVLYAIAGSLPLFLNDLHAIIASRLALGLAECVLITVGYSLISDYYAPDERRKWLAFQAAAGSIVGAALTFGGGLLAEISWRGPFAIYLVAIPILIASLIWLWEPERQPEEEVVAAKGGVSFPWAVMGLVALVTLFSSTLFYGYIIQIGVALDRLGLTNSGAIGIISGIAALAVIVGALVSRPVIKLPIGLQFFIVFGVIGSGMGVIGLAPNWEIAGVGAAIQQFGAGMLVPVLVAWTHRFLTFEHRNRGTGMWAASFFLGQFTCPLVVGLIHGVQPDQQLAIAVLGGFGLAAALIGLALSRKGSALPA